MLTAVQFAPRISHDIVIIILYNILKNLYTSLMLQKAQSEVKFAQQKLLQNLMVFNSYNKHNIMVDTEIIIIRKRNRQHDKEYDKILCTVLQ